MSYLVRYVNGFISCEEVEAVRQLNNHFSRYRVQILSGKRAGKNIIVEQSDNIILADSFERAHSIVLMFTERLSANYTSIRRLRGLRSLQQKIYSKRMRLESLYEQVEHMKTVLRKIDREIWYKRDCGLIEGKESSALVEKSIGFSRNSRVI